MSPSHPSSCLSIYSSIDVNPSIWVSALCQPQQKLQYWHLLEGTNKHVYVQGGAPLPVINGLQSHENYWYITQQKP